jgi:hypothetical protein
MLNYDPNGRGDIFEYCNIIGLPYIDNTFYLSINL